MRRRATLAALLVAGRASALAPAAPGASIEVDVALVVHDAQAGEEHLFVGARARSIRAGSLGVIARLPRGARVADEVPGATDALLGLAAEAKLPSLSGPSPTARIGDAASACKELGVTCSTAALTWSAARRDRDALVLRLTGDEGARAGAWAHVIVPTPTPFIPFAAPELDDVDRGELVPPDDAHPPRIKLWVELGVETRTGAWERAADRALAETEPRLARCWRDVADKQPRLAGDLHVQLRLPAGATQATAEGERANGKALGRVARCYARELERVTWPKGPGLRAAPLEVHALIKPPVARARAAWFVVLATTDVEPRLGDDLGGAVPDARVVVSREPEARELEAWPREVRAALGVSPSRRYRLVVVETRADGRPVDDDVRFRPLAAPAPAASGQPDWPIVLPGDRASRASPTKPARWRPSRRTKLLGSLGAGLGFALLVAWLTARSERREAKP